MSMSKSCSMTCQSVSEGEETRLREDKPSQAKVRLRSQARQKGKDIALLDTQRNYRTCTPGRISWGTVATAEAILIY